MSQPSDDQMVDSRIEAIYSEMDAAILDKMRPCEECGGWFPISEMRWDEETDQHVCTECDAAAERAE